MVQARTQPGRQGSGWRRAHAGLAAWCAQRSVPGAIARSFLLAWLIYIGVRHLLDREYASLFFWLSAPIHEAGHFIVSLSGSEILTVAAGTAFQIAAPLLAGVNFVRQKDYFALVVCGVWLATSLYYVAWYMADARSQAYPSFRPFGIDADIHDWHYLLSRLGLLAWDTTLAGIVRVLALLTMWLALAAGVYMVALMLRPKRG